MNKKQRMGLEIRGTDSYEAVISSEFPVERDGMDEVLVHTDGSVDLSRFPLPLLVNHNLNNQIGTVENPRLEQGKLIADIRFTNDDMGKQYEEDVIDKVRNNLSIGYKVLKSKIVNGVKEVTDFLIYETSIVPVPADPTATFRSDYQNQNLIYRNMNMEEKQTRSEKKASLKTESQIREELSEIITLGAKHNQSELASRHIENGSSIDEFRADLMSHIATKPLDLGTAPAFIQSRNEDYSVAKAILGMDDVSQRGFEWEVSQDLERQQPKSNPNAVIIDMTRTMTSGTAGANTIETNISSSIADFMQQKSILQNLGASNFAGNTGNLDIAIGSSDSGVTALQTDGSTQAGEVTPTLTKLSLVAKRFGTVIPLSYGFLQQSTPDVEGYVRRLIAETFAKNMDDQIIGGSGSSGNVTGLLNTTGINVVSNGGSEVTFANFMSAISELGTDAVDVSNLKLIVNPSNLDNLVTAVKYTSTDSPILDMKADSNGKVGTFMGYPVYATSKISPDNYLMGDFSHLAIASWGGLELAKDDFYDTRRFNSAITGIHTFDAGALNPTAFCKITKA
ncbi:phage major capsid protein [Gammaproteobacteria bacterium]|nr:phage major capsid protein [Gammaproteobacteria bacterium]